MNNNAKNSRMPFKEMRMIPPNGCSWVLIQIIVRQDLAKPMEEAARRARMILLPSGNENQRLGREKQWFAGKNPGGQNGPPGQLNAVQGRWNSAWKCWLVHRGENAAPAPWRSLTRAPGKEQSAIGLEDLDALAAANSLAFPNQRLAASRENSSL